MPWTVYILECADRTLYTGITNDMESRLAKHAKGTGAKYTRGRSPYKVIHTELHATKGQALKREAEIKSLDKRQKLALAEGGINHFLALLRQFANPERAAWDRNYHKSSREHWGVTAPACVSTIRSIAGRYDRSQLMRLAQELWQTDKFDAMIAATRILGLPKVTPDRALWRMITGFMPDVDGWGLEDNLTHAAWKCILADETLLDEVESWTRNKDFWMRRATLIFTLPYARPGRDPERMLGWAAGYADDPEWFMQKAIGWWLRDLGAHNPERVIRFLKRHWPSLKGVAKKEATRKLEPRLLKWVT